VKISAVEVHLVDPGASKNWLLVKLTTDEGVSGWGEAYAMAGREPALAAHVNAMAPQVIGRDPFNIKHFIQVMYDDYAIRRGSVDFYCAVSALEIAMWDIVGKSLNVPVYKLLGGACREKVRVYANGWWFGASSPKEYATRAAQMVEKGFNALKFDPFTGPWRTFIDRDDELQAVKAVREIRSAVGDKVDLLIEIHRRLAPMHAIRVGRMLEEFRPYWYEEPCPAENMDAVAEVRRAINIPVVTGETLYTKAEFRQVFEKQAADIINPDTCICCGILGMKEIAAMAEPYLVSVTPHNYNSTVIGLAATLNVCACITNCDVTEYFWQFDQRGKEVAANPFEVVDGYIKLPQTPGLGIEIDETALARYPFHDYGMHGGRRVRDYHQER